MFAIRGFAVSLTFFVVLYCVLSFLVVAGWRSLTPWHTKSAGSLANLLFGLRILPTAASLAMTLGLVVPSFQLLEPRSIEEDIGLLPLVLGFCALLLIACGIVRVVTAKIGTSRIVARWMDGATRARVGPEVTTFRSTHDVPPLTLVGVLNPKVVMSESAFRLLSTEELSVAIKHEVAHVRAHDNLKKLVLRFSPFPGMDRLESAWSQMAELAADDGAVSNQDDAVDLAAALVKLSRLVPTETAPACSIGLVTGSPIRTRIARLLAWDDVTQSREVKRQYWYTISCGVAALLCILAIYGPALNVTHQITEWIVR